MVNSMKAMENQSIGKLIIGQWNTMTLIVITVGSILFALMTVFGRFSIFGNVGIETSMLVPIFVGVFFGPVPTFITLAIGWIGVDLLMGWGFYVENAIGYGVIGFFVGALPLYGAKVNKGVFGLMHATIYVFCCIVAIVFGHGVVMRFLTSIMNPYYYWGGGILWSLSIASYILFTLIVIGTPLLYLMTYLYSHKIKQKNQ